MRFLPPANLFSAKQVGQLSWAKVKTTLASRFALPVLLLPTDCEYHFRLDGFHFSWQIADSTRRADFSKLSGGNYRLRVQARRAGGDWGAEASLGIRVHQNFWENPIFRTFLLVLGLAGAWLFYRYLFGQRQEQIEISQLRTDQANLSRLISEARMASLQARMNPDFILNSLIGIQQLLGKNELKLPAPYS